MRLELIVPIESGLRSVGNLGVVEIGNGSKGVKQHALLDPTQHLLGCSNPLPVR